MTRTGSVILLLTAWSAAEARADIREWDVCNGGALRTCASVTLSYANDGSDHILTLTVRNLSGYDGSHENTIFTAIGLHDLGDVRAYKPNGRGFANGQRLREDQMTGATRGNPNRWRVNNDVGDADIAVYTFGNGNHGIASDCNTSGVPNLWVGSDGRCTDYDGSIVITLEVSGPLSLENAWISVRGETEWGETYLYCANGDDGTCQDMTHTPEPLTMMLLGTGLVGISGAGWVRRRREREEAAEG